MTPRAVVQTTAVLLVVLAGEMSGQGSVLPPLGRPYLFALDLQGTGLDEFPSGVRALNGVMTVVDRNGQHVLQASSPSEILITLAQPLPADFTVELDVIPKACCAPDDIMLEGTPTRNRGVASAELTWHPERISAVGGGGEMYQSAMPADLAASTPGNLTHLIVEFQGIHIKLYTNGRRLYTLEKQFVRGRVLRVWLGGESATNPMYLAGLRVGAGPAAPGVIAAGAGLPGGGAVTPNQSSQPAPQTVGTQQAASGGGRVVPNVAVTMGSGGPLVSWGLLGGVTSYSVKRWKLTDLTCCNAASPALSGPPWQDGALPVAGTYVFEVTGTSPGWTATGQAQFVQFKTAGQIGTVAPAPPPPTPPPAPIAGPVLRTATTATLAPPTNLTVNGTPATASLTWQPPSGWTPTGYTVVRNTVGTSISTLLTTSPITTTRFDDQSGFSAGQSYQYVVAATSGNPLANGVAQVQFSPPAPQNVSNLIAQQTGSDVTLSWAVANGASNYVVVGGQAPSRQIPGPQNRATYSNLPVGTYTWSVGASWNPGAIQTPASTWPSVTLAVMDPQPVLAEGKLYKEVSRPEIFVLLDNKKIHIPTMAALNFMGYTPNDVTNVIDGALNQWKQFDFTSGSPTPGSVLFPPKVEYAPLRPIPGSTRIPTQGLFTQVGELRGWMRWSENPNCGEGDIKYGLELDSEWAVRQGINLHDILWVGNLYTGIGYPGSSERRMITAPVIQVELNSSTWKDRYTDPNQRPADWQFPRDCDGTTRWFPFDPGFPTFLENVIPDINAVTPASPRVYVRIVGTLLTDNPHAWDPANPWYNAARDWHPGVDPMTNPTHFARWTEVHPPDLIEPVTRDPNLPLAKLVAVGLAAAPTECQVALFDLAPDQPGPPGSVLAWEELRGVETFWPSGENAQNGSWVTELGDHIAVRASVCGGGLGGSPGRFKAFYRVWWK